jgi:hypothetical protein
MRSNSALELVMTLAAQEAVAAGYPEITPAHLLIALCCASEADQVATTPAMSTALQHEFEALGIEPRRFRRHLRALVGHGGAQHQGDAIHRSPACKAVFICAERVAAAEQASFDVVHLVRAAFIVLSEGSGTDGSTQATEGVAAQTDDLPTEL